MPATSGSSPWTIAPVLMVAGVLVGGAPVLVLPSLQRHRHAPTSPPNSLGPSSRKNTCLPRSMVADSIVAVRVRDRRGQRHQVGDAVQADCLRLVRVLAHALMHRAEVAQRHHTR